MRLSATLWIYRPWLEQVGLALPATIEEFEQVLQAFKDQNPNEDGEADEVLLVTALKARYSPIAGSVNAAPTSGSC